MLSSFKTKCKNVKTQLLQLVHFYFLSGRTLFYDSYGVVSDVMQNHLSEILYKITKNSSTTLHDYEEDKLDLQDQVSAVNKNKHVVFSQYKGNSFSCFVPQTIILLDYYLVLLNNFS